MDEIGTDTDGGAGLPKNPLDWTEKVTENHELWDARYRATGAEVRAEKLQRQLVEAQEERDMYRRLQILFLGIIIGAMLAASARRQEVTPREL